VFSGHALYSQRSVLRFTTNNKQGRTLHEIKRHTPSPESRRTGSHIK